MREAVKNRMSHTIFDREFLAEAERTEINNMLDKINDESGLNLTLLENGKKIFEHFKPSYGKFKNVHSMIIMKGPIFLPHLREKIGYYGEKLILDLVDMGIANSWVTGKFNKKGGIDVPSNEVFICLILLGKANKAKAKDKVRHSIVLKSHKTVSMRLDSTAKPPEWIINGIEAVRVAPSYKDTQRPNFKYNGEVLTVGVPNNKDYDMIDLGIAKAHFETAVNGKFDFGNGGIFHLDSNEEL